ncbi:MAG: hypothetical protein VX431_05610 [Planctomycetota bacterium]|nr:hypothetical protein [Planctomycetota bacterium]
MSDTDCRRQPIPHCFPYTPHFRSAPISITLGQRFGQNGETTYKNEQKIIRETHMLTHQQRWAGAISLLVASFCLIALVGWTHDASKVPDGPPAILGTWSWYSGTMQVKSDGTCHWKGANHEEHGRWKKADGYLFDWGEKDNDWNYLGVDEEGRLAGRFIKWGGELMGTRPGTAEENSGEK